METIDPYVLMQLRETGMPWAKISRFFGFSRNGMYKYRKRHGLGEPNREISDEEVLPLIRNFAAQHPSWGSVTIRGMLLAMGYQVAEKRIRAVLRIVDPEAVVSRKRKKLKRRVYSVPGANYYWHIDGHHKLVLFYFVVHGCIDGYSRKVIYSECSANNRAASVLNLFQQAISRSGIPHRVRVDYGCENGGVADLMAEIYQEGSRCVFGPSTRNQRIERHWRDVPEKVIDDFKDLFIFMENEDIFDGQNLLDVICLHYVYTSRIQKELDVFTEAWNSHRVRTMHWRTPNQEWLLSMTAQHPDMSFQISSVNHNRPLDHTIESILNSSYVQHIPEDILDHWLNNAIYLLPDPLQDDGNSGINHYVMLRTHLMHNAP